MGGVDQLNVDTVFVYQGNQGMLARGIKMCKEEDKIEIPNVSNPRKENQMSVERNN